MISSNKSCHDEPVILIEASCNALPNQSLYPFLTELNLSNLQFTIIDMFPFEQFPNLRSLDLSHNQLTSINPNWSTYHENLIEQLNLSHNKLDTLLFLKDFKHLKSLNVTDNLLRNHERFLSLYICPTIENLIDADQEQIHNDQLKLDGLLFLIERNIDRMWLSLSTQNTFKEDEPIPQVLLDHFRQLLMKIIEQQIFFSGFHLSILGQHLLDKKLNEFRPQLSSRNMIASLADNFNRSLRIHDKKQSKVLFEPIKYIRCHHVSNADQLVTPVLMSAFEPNTTNHILATCGGQKLCILNCDTYEVTHLFEVNKLHLKFASTSRQIISQQTKPIVENFSCLCWIALENPNEMLKILAVGSTHGHIYLLSPKWNLMFGRIELPASSITCLTWHGTSPLILIVGSHHTVRFINIRSYVDRLQSFVRKQKKSTAVFDYVDSSAFVHKVPITHVYNLYSGIGPLVTITDLQCCLLSDKKTVLLVGTTSGLFIIQFQDKQEQEPIQLTFPESIRTLNGHVESFRLIDESSNMIAMNILGLDHICCFDLEHSLKEQQVYVTLLLPNCNRHNTTKIATNSTQNNAKGTSKSLECVAASNYNSFVYYQIQLRKTLSTKSSFDYQQLEIPFEENEFSSSMVILSASLNKHYLCLTTNSNLICIFKRN